jgi:transposase
MSALDHKQACMMSALPPKSGHSNAHLRRQIFSQSQAGFWPSDNARAAPHARDVVADFVVARVVARWFSAHFPIWAGNLKVPERNEKQEE